ncbi:Fe2+-dependent dioxygenase [Merismopedia glauca]|uniref:Fe2+-dependent dioxygenase n=1 Tax=Merismopedia glauca CCAP 1448/3 TaxID=1296344 RepID=A0A2T1C9B0_9CYAN|nr:Fe2+-dependent dioxygenase [Merismopedia glauca]PSB04748.1 Fe2+-dependent dioxygenase [Merismopedia glauca CCAP 1448/3]
MIFSLEEVLKTEELKHISDRLNPSDFIDGQKTAGWHAKLVKNNQQLPKSSQAYPALSELVKNALERHPLFTSAAQPKVIHSVIFSRYEVGMSYGTHVDNAFMGGDNYWRSDLSFTIFLSPPDSYTGGELVMELSDGDRSYRLEAGAAIIYPASTLHRVETVTQGIRFAAVGWIQSLVRNSEHREILFDLDTVRRSIFAKEGKSLEFDLISKNYANLLRMWGS